EGNESGAAAGLLARLFERDRLRVFDFVVKVEAFAHNLPVNVNNYGADQWSGTDLAHALRSQAERAQHHLAIEIRGSVCCGSHRLAAGLSGLDDADQSAL